MSKWVLILALSIGVAVVYEKPAEAGFFRRGPMMRFLFGGPIRRRMIARRMFRRGFCGSCMARRRVPRCGPGVHGRGCGFNNQNFRNFRDFRNQRNFQFFNDPLRSQFDPGLNPALNPFINPNASQFLPFQNSQPFNPNGGFSAVSAQVKESELEKLFLRSQEPAATVLNNANWSGFCEENLGNRTSFELSEPSLAPKFREGALVAERPQQTLFIREVSDQKLILRKDDARGRSYCLVEKIRN